jgi:sodium-independent organic anion transporter
MAVIFLGFFITGIGTSFFHSFGIPYIDDNVPKNASPAVLGLVLGFRTLGPGLGAILGSVSLGLYVAPGRAPDLREGDDGWLGAWWLGFVVVGGLTALLSPVLALFPRRLAGEAGTEAATEAAQAAREDEPSTAREYVRHTLACAARLAKNKIYVFNILSGVTLLIGFVGFSTFIPKFFEYHFRQDASKSGFAGLGSSLATGLGVILSGQVIARYRFTARTLARWAVFIGVVAFITVTVIATIACPRLEVVDTTGLPCRTACSCTEAEFRPTCSMDGSALFLSPCHAGCTTSSLRTVGGEERTVYTGCSCVGPASNISLSPLEAALAAPEEQLALAGHCPGNCDTKFYLVIGIFATMSLLASTGRVGGTLISLRAVQPRDKSASLVILISLLSLFAFFPSPIIYGAMLDGACTVWGFSCGERTNCLIYNTDQMRQYMCGLTAGCIALSTLFDVGVWYHVGDLQIWEEEPVGKGDSQESKV